MKPAQLSLSVLLIMLVLSSLAACQSGAEGSLTSQSGELSTPAIRSPTYTTTEVFNCWTASRSGSSVDGNTGLGRLLIVDRGYGDSTQPPVLYSLDLSTKDFSVLVPHLENYGPNRPLPISPNGRHLWYGVYHGASEHSVFVYDLIDDTVNQVPFLDRLHVQRAALNWSADSECLILWRHSTATAYRVSDGAMQQRIFPDVDFGYDSQVDPSPDGQWWAWPCQEGICIVDSETGEFVHHEGLLLPANSDATGRLYVRGLIRWSPNGRALAFAFATRHYRFTDTIRLLFLNKDGITSYQDKDIDTGVHNMYWSPDGDQLLIAQGGVGQTLLVYNAVTGDIMTLMNPLGFDTGVTPVWSPDGKQIAFLAEEDHGLYRMHADGTNISSIPLSTNTGPSFGIGHIFWVP